MDALFSEFECMQLPGQVDLFEAIAEVEAETAAALVPAPALPGDGSLFALRVTNTPADGALFGLTI